MRGKELSVGSMVTLAICTLTLLATSTYAATEKVLFSFNITDGGDPQASLIFDTAGNLYGTTSGGGAHNPYGTVFELTPKAGGGWTEKVLYSFNYGNGEDGYEPYAGLIFDGAGNLYGMTARGGRSTLCPYGCGTVFELTPKAGGGWEEKVLHAFDFNNGAYPLTSLIFDASGNLYGTTPNGGGGACNYGSEGCGTVFELTPKAGGGWTEKVLHNFSNYGTDGYQPLTGLIFDGAGNLFGTTSLGGRRSAICPDGGGTVFELTPKAGGGWTEKVLYSLDDNAKGLYPNAGVVIDGAGNLYGTTTAGGAHASGTVFELTPKTGGGWTEKVLHSFGGGEDGYEPLAALILDAAGNLYGTTNAGGAHGVGTVFELTPKAGGEGWTEKVLHSFLAYDKDGVQPQAGLIFDAADNLYGTTTLGGAHGEGTVFEIKP